MPPPYRLFFVEDNDLIRPLLAEYFHQPPDLEVAGTAATAREALERIPSEAPDLVIIDIDLGEGPTGFDLVRSLLLVIPTLKCIVHSAHGNRFTRQMALNAGAVDFVLKGSIERLEATIAHFLKDGEGPASTSPDPLLLLF